MSNLDMLLLAKALHRPYIIRTFVPQKSLTQTIINKIAIWY